MVAADHFDLSGRSALVTGACGHLGRSLCLALAKAGAHVLVNSRDQAKAEEFAEQMRKEGFEAAPFVCDVTNRDAVIGSLNERKGPPVAVLVNNAYAGGAGTVWGTSTNDYRAAFESSVISSHSLVQLLLDEMKSAAQEFGDAAIVNIASMYGVVSPDFRVYDQQEVRNPAYYGAAKAALIQFTRAAAIELGPFGIRVNALSPGPFPNETVISTNPAFVKRLQAKVPIGRIGEPHELEGPLLLLSTRAGSYITGQNLLVDGGWTAW